MIALLALLLCGSERWAVKVLSDPSAVSVRLAPLDITIGDLNAWPKAPGRGPRDGREYQLYRVTGRVTLVKREADGDLHIVLSDGRRTVIVESPSVSCAARSHFRTVLTAARARCESFRVGQAVRVQGPAFGDFDHGQTGRARSSYEIHPVMFVSP